MKIRNGFVSNSSSSSFVVVVDKKAHDSVIKSLHEYHQAWFKSIPSVIESKFMGNDVVTIGIHICSEDDAPIDGYKGTYPSNAEDYWGDGQKMVPSDEIMSDYINKVKKITKDIIVNEDYR